MPARSLAFLCTVALAAAALFLSGCGKDAAPGEGAAADPTGNEAPAPAPARCDDITFTPNSGDGAFDVEAEGLDCSEAEKLLRRDRTLRGWRCEVLERYPPGNGRRRCRDGGRTITYTTGV